MNINKQQREKEYKHAEMKLNFYSSEQFMNKHFKLFEYLLHPSTCNVFSVREFFPFYVQIIKYLFNDSSDKIICSYGSCAPKCGY